MEGRRQSLTFNDNGDLVPTDGCISMVPPSPLSSGECSRINSVRTSELEFFVQRRSSLDSSEGRSPRIERSSSLGCSRGRGIEDQKLLEIIDRVNAIGRSPARGGPGGDTTSEEYLYSEERSSDMEEEEDPEAIKAALNESIAENNLLQNQLQEQGETIEKVLMDLKGALVVLEDVKSRRNSFRSNSIPCSPLRMHKVRTVEESTQEEVYQSDDGEMTSFRVRMIETFSQIQIDQRDLIYRMGSTGRIAGQILAGNIVGWTSHLLLRKFGKLALTAVGGGILTLHFAYRKGLINVNWVHITERILQLDERGEGSPEETREEVIGEVDQVPDGRIETWLHDKVEKFKGWTRENSYAMAGFVAIILYKTLS